MRTFLVRTGFVIGSLLVCGLALAVYVVVTPHGSRVATQAALRWMFRAETIHHEQLTGTLWDGLTVRALDVPEAGGVLQGSAVHLEDGALGALGSLVPPGISFELGQLQLSDAPFAKHLRAASVGGTWPGEFILQEVVVEEPAGWPPGTKIDLQRVRTGLPLQREQVRAVYNGRLRLPYSDTVMFSGSQIDGGLNMRLFSKAVDLGDVLGALPVSPLLRRARGVLSDIDLSVAGTLAQPTVAGHGVITTLAYRGWTVTKAPAVIALSIQPDADFQRIALHGRVSCSGGTLSAKETTVRLRTAQVTFDGDPAQPSFDVQGTSTIGGTTIRIVLKGTRTQPELRLTSEPPLPQGVLLVMLATGKRWRGAQDAVMQGRISAELASDFVDYFIFGGAGSRLAARFGITDLAVTREAETGLVGVKSTIADRLDVGLKTDPAQLKQTDAAAAGAAPVTPSTIPYKAELEYQVNGTTAVGLEAQRTPSKPSPSASSSDEASAGASAPQAEDTVLLKLKKRF